MYKPYGIIPPIITPFDETGAVDYAALAKMAVHLVDNGVHGLFPLGTTGEFYAVNDEQFVKILETVRDAVAGKTNRYGKPIQLIAGCSHITTREVCRLIKLVEQVGGYDAVSVLTPMFVSQTQDELYNYYKTIADSTTMPVIMYNNQPTPPPPSRPPAPPQDHHPPDPSTPHRRPPGRRLRQHHRRQGFHRRYDQHRGIPAPDRPLP